MKASYVAVGVLGLTFGGLWFLSGGTKPPQASAAEQPLKVAAPVAHENLTVFLVRGPEAAPSDKLITLQEGLECGWAVVHETGDVNELLVENLSPDHDLFVQSQDLIKGGRQDRLIASDMLLAPGSGRVPVRVHCVEQGRWTGRDNAPSDRFTVSSDGAVGKSIKLANANRDQGQVWNEVKQCQDKLGKNLGRNVADPQYQSSLQMTLDNPAVREKIAEYEAALRPVGNESGVIGVVFAVNGRVTGAEVYGSSTMFKKAWPKLLRAAAGEAVMEKSDARTANAPSPREVEWFLAHGDKDRYDGDVIPNETILVNSEERLVTANGAVEFRGRSGATRSQLLVNSGGANRDLTNEDVGLERALSVTADSSIVPEPSPNAPPLPSPQPAANPAGQVSAWTVGSQPRQNAQDSSLLRQLSVTDPVPQPVNPDGNRLNTNRVESRTTLTLESRDAARPGVVIHKSYIKK